MSAGPTAGGRPRGSGAEFSASQLVRSSVAGLARKDAFLRVALLPVLGVFLFQAIVAGLGFSFEYDPANPQPPAPEVILTFLLGFAVNLVCGTLFSVNWTRMLLLGPDAVRGLGLQWGARETRYLLRSLVISFVSAALLSLILLPIVAAFGESAITVLAVLAVVLAYLFYLVRALLLLPAAAVDDPLTLREASAVPGRLAARILAALLIVFLPFMLLLVLLARMATFLGLGQLAPFATTFVFVVLDFAFAAVTTGIDAYAFRAITGRRTDRATA